MTALRRARLSFARDHAAGLGTGAIARKVTRYLSELATAPLYLREVTETEPGIRTLGRPRIANEGFMSIGSGTLVRSVNVAVELATGPNGCLRIGRDVSINYGVSIGCLAQIDIGDRCRLGPYVMIVDSDFHDFYDRGRRPPPRKVSLAEDVWVGAKASILPGVTIGRGAIVGIGAVVTADVAPFTVVGGVPARLIRTLTPGLFVAPNDATPLEGTR